MSAISVPDGTAEPITYINRSRNSNSSSALDPNHTHFVMVDDGTVGQFGAEVALRTDCEQLLRHDLGVPGVQLVVQGGPNTLTTVMSSLITNCPVLLVKESGGCAQLIADFVEPLLAEAEQLPQYDEAGARSRRVKQRLIEFSGRLRQWPDGDKIGDKLVSIAMRFELILIFSTQAR